MAKENKWLVPVVIALIILILVMFVNSITGDVIWPGSATKPYKVECELLPFVMNTDEDCKENDYDFCSYSEFEIFGMHGEEEFYFPLPAMCGRNLTEPLPEFHDYYWNVATSSITGWDEDSYRIIDMDIVTTCCRVVKNR